MFNSVLLVSIHGLSLAFNLMLWVCLPCRVDSGNQGDGAAATPPDLHQTTSQELESVPQAASTDKPGTILMPPQTPSKALSEAVTVCIG